MFSEISWDGVSGREGGGGARFFYRFKGGHDQKSLRTTALNRLYNHQNTSTD